MASSIVYSENFQPIDRSILKTERKPSKEEVQQSALQSTINEIIFQKKRTSQSPQHHHHHHSSPQSQLHNQQLVNSPIKIEAQSPNSHLISQHQSQITYQQQSQYNQPTHFNVHRPRFNIGQKGGIGKASPKTTGNILTTDFIFV